MMCAQRAAKKSTRIVSHGLWPVEKLRTGQKVRIRGRNYGAETVFEIKRLFRSGDMVVISGAGAADVALHAGARVELVSYVEV